MTVPLCARSVAAVIGGLLVPAAWSSGVKTLIVPRPGGGGLARRLSSTGVARLTRAALGYAIAVGLLAAAPTLVNRDRRARLDRRGQRHVLDHGQLDHPARLQS